MKHLILPYKAKKVSRKNYKKLEEIFAKAPKAPIAQLQKEAIEFEQMMLERRASKVK